MSQSAIRIAKYILKALYAIIVIKIIYFGYVILNTSYDGVWIYDVAKFSGDLAVIFLVFTLLPGIFLRFQLKSPIFIFLRQIRGELGQVMFLLALSHYLMLKVFPAISFNSMPTFELFEIFGLIALSLTLPLFITSNKFSIRKMGKWWKYLHMLVYIVLWLVFIHIALVKINWITIVAGILLVLEVSSLAYKYSRSK